MRICLRLSTIVLISTLSTGVFAQNSTESAIQTYLDKNHSSLGLHAKDVKEWVVTDNFVSSSSGVHHVHIAQTINGIPVKNGLANVSLNSADSVLYVANRFVKNVHALQAGGATPSLGAREAILRAAGHLDITGEPGAQLETDKVNHELFGKGTLSQEDIDVELGLWFTGEEVALTWIVTIYKLDGDHWWQLYVDAHSGEELNRVDWVQHCEFGEHTGSSREAAEPSPLHTMTPPPSTDQYNVFPLPVESPNHGTNSLEIGPSDATASPLGWHDVDGVAGAEYTITRGNNVFAYEDQNDDNNPGYSPDGGAGLDFNFPINLSQNPSGYLDPAITNLFYICNRAHDILYHYGFDEVSGNFQENNYGNGGAATDYVLAEAQDGGGTNNANFASPADGQNPRMQMYLWTSTGGNTNLLTVNTPAGIAGQYSASEASFGPGVPATPITADLVMVDDATAPDANDGCEAAINAASLSGKIAVVYRGNCNFTVKVEEAQNAGAVAVIVINNAAGAPITMGGTNPAITIPSIMISQADGAAIAAQMGTGTVNATIVNSTGNFDRDGDFDNGVVLHEYGHGVSTRLTGGPSNANCLNNDEQMGEGWSDYICCALTMDMTASNPVYRPIGTYATSEAPSGIGIRNAPYDTSFSVNPYTYGDVADQANVSMPHGIGFIWATMLWDLHWAFIDQYGFDPNIETGTGGNNMALQLVMEGMKIQPCSPGFVDGRDAILLADQVLYGGANECLIWSVFARRGLGSSADQGSSNSRTDQVEAFDMPPACLTPVTAPTPEFDANVYVTCTGEVMFEDQSTNIPQGWVWDFGDGNTSTLPNPSHTYAAPGLYTVTLTVSNSIGSSSPLVKTDFIEVTILDDPIAVDGSGCASDSILLTATASETIHWTDASGNFLASGNSYYTTPSASSSSYYAVNVLEFPHTNVGPVDNSFGGGGNHNTAFIGAHNIDAYTSVTIHSAWIDAGSAGTRTVTLWDAYNSGGTPIQVVNVAVPVAGPQRVDLGLMIPGPGQYSFGLDNADLYRNNSGASYPYTAAGLMSIVSSSATGTPLDYYYYFYDLEVSETSCVSDSVLVTATVTSSDFTWSTNGLVVDFTDQSTGATSWAWDFGDGNTSTTQNPSHTYTQNGLYVVTLTTDGGCTFMDTVNVGGVGMDELVTGGHTISLYPNPAGKETMLSLGRKLSATAELRIYSAEGKLVKALTLEEGASQVTISLEGMSPQVYILELEYEFGQERERLIVR